MFFRIAVLCLEQKLDTNYKSICKNIGKKTVSDFFFCSPVCLLEIEIILFLQGTTKPEGKKKKTQQKVLGTSWEKGICQQDSEDGEGEDIDIHASFFPISNTRASPASVGASAAQDVLLSLPSRPSQGSIDK